MKPTSETGDEARKISAAVLRRLAQVGASAPGDDALATYELLQPLHSIIAKTMTSLRQLFTAEQQREFKLALRAKAGHARKDIGTGAYDTPEATWEKMRAAHLAGETQRSLSKRFGVLYYSITRRRWADRRCGRPWREAPPAPPTNVIELFGGRR